MRLLYTGDDGEFHLTENLTECPPYAVLSHRWTNDEVTLKDILNQAGREKRGYKKLEFCAAQAKQDDLEYFWVDTCCIDKSNLAELSKTILSMYRWYAESRHCYVYLTDVSGAMSFSEWFERGWTLQELLAPTSVKFFDKNGCYLGSRQELAEFIHGVTGIENEALNGRSLDQFTVSTRLSWAAMRQTTEPEDIVYSLLGIFGISMPPLYGEGAAAAFDRLKEGISRKFDVDLMRLDVSALFTKKLVPLSDDRQSAQYQIQGRPVSHQNIRDESESLIRRAEIVKNLGFAAMESRRANIDLPLEGTCDWLFGNASYIEWKTRRSSFLWMKAHPGAGKSTLMKFMDYQISDEIGQKNDTLISFYFNARGDRLERSVAGMYRSLIVQLFKSTNGLDLILDNLHFRRKSLPPATFFLDPPLAVLREVLAACVAGLRAPDSDPGKRHIYCLIDALDETDEEEVLEMVEFLRHQAQHGQLSICFASRHYPTLDLPVPLQIIVEHESGHQKDLEHYVQSRLRVGADSQIRSELLGKANGIFMWIVLVVEILNRESRHGSLPLVRKRLNQLPSKLADLIKDIAQQGDVSDDDYLLCLQWLLFAQRQLSLPEFYFAMLSGLSEDSCLVWNKKEVTVEDMEHFLITYSKGMAEVTRSRRPRVQMIHESFRDFFLRDNGIQYISKSGDSKPEQDAQKRLAKCCLRAFRFGYDYWQLASPRAQLYREGRRMYEAILESSDTPFFKYSLVHGLDHVDLSSWSFKMRCSKRPIYQELENWNQVHVDHKNSRDFAPAATAGSSSRGE